MSFINSRLTLSPSALSEEQLRRLEEAITEVKRAKSSGQAIPESDYDAFGRFMETTTLPKIVVAEKLLQLGEALKPTVRRLLDSTSDSETKTLAALVLQKLGDLSVTPVLLNTLRRGDVYFPLVAWALAESGTMEAAPIIFEFITSNITIEQYDLLAQSLAALNKLHYKIPEKQRQKWLSDPKCHPYVRLELVEHAFGWGSWSLLKK